MGYYLKLKPEPSFREKVRELGIAALLKFKATHTVEIHPIIEPDFLNKTVKISAGETETYTFEELGFSI
jgi:hypothetical protein